MLGEPVSVVETSVVKGIVENNVGNLVGNTVSVVETSVVKAVLVEVVAW